MVFKRPVDRRQQDVGKKNWRIRSEGRIGRKKDMVGKKCGEVISGILL